MNQLPHDSIHMIVFSVGIMHT